MRWSTRTPLAAAVRRKLDELDRKTTWLVVETKAVAAQLARREGFSAEWLRLVDAEAAAEALLPSMASVDPLVRRQALWSALNTISIERRTRYFPSTAVDARIGWESAKPIVLGDKVWLSGGVIVCPGVTIGDDTVVGAGSVITRDPSPPRLRRGCWENGSDGALAEATSG